MPITTIIVVPVISGSIPNCGGVKSGAHTVPNNWVVISESTLKVVGKRETTIPTVTKTETNVAATITATMVF
jgi:hypothetical protein